MLPNPLTQRQLDVLILMAQGYTDYEIGSKLYLSAGTVNDHTIRIYRKLGAVNRAHAVALGFEEEILKVKQRTP